MSFSLHLFPGDWSVEAEDKVQALRSEAKIVWLVSIFETLLTLYNLHINEHLPPASQLPLDISNPL